MDIDMDFLHDGIPVEYLRTEDTYIKYTEPGAEEIKSASFGPDLEKLLGRKNIWSFSGEATVDGKVAAEGSFLAQLYW